MTLSGFSLFFASLLKRVKKWIMNFSTAPPIDPFLGKVNFNKEDERQIASLKYHAGFNALMGKLEHRKRGFEQILYSTKHKDIRAVDDLQAYIREILWIQREVAKELPKPDESKYYDVDLTPVIREMIDRIGPD